MHLTPGDWRPVTGTQGGKRSGVWNYFKKNHELQMASCNECGTILSAKGGTTTALRNHLTYLQQISYSYVIPKLCASIGTLDVLN